jgi:hypothetical protein
MIIWADCKLAVFEFTCKINIILFRVINGGFKGITDPIVVDRKPLTDYCAHKPYYVFNICPLDKRALLSDKHSVCSEGFVLTILY